MKKFFACLLALACMCSFAWAEEEEEGYGAAVVGNPAEITDQMELELAEYEPYVPEHLEKTVFGRDDRTTIKQTNQYPYSAIAYLKVKGQCGCDWTGSGFMVGKSGMVTAAHCLVCKTHNQWVKGMTMYFGYRNDKNYAYRYNEQFTYWYGVNPYATGRYSETNDYAYIKLNKNVGEQVGSFGIRYAQPSQDGQVYNLAGYRHGVLKTSSGTVSVYNDLLFKYVIDTEPGNSGCPVFDNEYYAVGINVSHSDTSNYAHRFPSYLVTEMRNNGIFN